MSPITGIGVDVVDVERFARVMARRPTLLGRLFSDAERANSRGRAESLAARFAAKEATWKAMGVGLFSTKYRDIEVVRVARGAPTLRLVGTAAELARERGITTWHISLTHDANVAQAFVIGESA